MKKLTFSLLILLFTHASFGQVDVHASATKQVNEMIAFYNMRDIPKYVDYLLPLYYGNENKYKEKFTETWERILKQDTDTIKLVGFLKLAKSQNQYQALFHINFKSGKSYTIGVSEDGKKWSFSQPFSEKMKFSQLLEIIPTLDHALAESLDPKFGKRINYEIGEIISPFKFKDINETEISSESLKGKVVVLNFWGTWCAPCVKEIPELNKLVEKFSGENVKFIAPAITTTNETLKNSFLPKHPFSYDIVVIDGDDYVISSYPTHVIINQDQKVIEIIKGYSEDNIKRLEQTIDDVLN
ncbi:TlpA family protein disulfide reductase [Formosa sp. 3Alg 14/1]|uniref:TlpA family protein disulfide reductase n=1 Tax=Formosa sp. 3Alg 14/1 TaxID=3382190 RepID=UPI0039BDD48D